MCCSSAQLYINAECLASDVCVAVCVAVRDAMRVALARRSMCV